MQVLSRFTTLINIVGLAISLGLGFYIVTRPPKRRHSWLAALTLWALACLFFYNALALNIPEGRTVYWLSPVALLVLPLWFHLILLLPLDGAQQRFQFYLPQVRLPKGVRQRLGKLLPIVSRPWVPLAYVLSLALLIGGVFPLGRLSEDSVQPAVLLSDREADLLFPLSTAFLVIWGTLALLSSWQGLREAQNQTRKREFARLLAATALAGFGGLYLGLGVWFRLALPSLVSDLAVVTAATILGYTIAEHNALEEGRSFKRDLLYISLAVGLLVALCIFIAQLLYLSGHIFSLLTLIVVIIVAITSLMLYDGMRTALDRLFYREQFQQLRANLRALAHEAGTSQSLPERLQAILHTLCHTLHIKQGFVTVRKNDAYVCEATERTALLNKTFPLPTLTANKIVELPRPGTDSPEGMVLLIPLYDDDDQLGALVLGSKETGRPYTEDDLMLLNDLADQLAIVIRACQQQEENARTINELVEEFRSRERTLQKQVQQMLAEREEKQQPVLQGISEREFASLVEDALRRLYDYPYLGEHTLAQLQVVDWYLEERSESFVTHIDRGKAVSEIVTQALYKLRPEGEPPNPHTVPSRKWHQFITLHDAYVLGELNRDIMSKLYISEGTFNRTRRRAVRGVARALREMERKTHH